MPAYFDHNASSPIDDKTLQAMLPYLQAVHANPSSLHQAGRLAKSAIETARLQIAQFVNCEPNQVVFMSGATEANNMVLQAHKLLLLNVGAVEHASVFSAAQKLDHVEWVKVNEHGVYQPESVSPDVGFISLQLVNNETGVIQPIAHIKEKYPNTLFHCDVAQALGKAEVDFKALGVDFLSLSAHKFNGPKGAGALIIKKPEAFDALIVGGYQEGGLRAGTENVAAIVGMGLAAESAHAQLKERIQRFLSLRDYFEDQLKQIQGVTIFSDSVNRVCNTSYFALPYFHGETFLMECDRAGFALTSGSACHSNVTTPSHVLRAMNIDESLALNAIRASFGVDNTRQQIDEFIKFIHVKLENLPASIKSVVGFK